MKWKELYNKKQLEDIIEESKTRPVFIFKHSTRCSVSSMALNRLEREWNLSQAEDVNTYLLSVIESRALSQEIESTFGVRHESPQALVISKGDCIFHNSHIAIKFNSIKDVLGKAIAG